VAGMEMGPEAPAPPPEGTGLYHVALRIGTTLDELRAARAHLEAHGIAKMRIRDHVVSQSIYVDDPDGNMVELYVDADPSTWREKPEAVANSRPLSLRTASPTPASRSPYSTSSAAGSSSSSL